MSRSISRLFEAQKKEENEKKEKEGRVRRPLAV